MHTTTNVTSKIAEESHSSLREEIVGMMADAALPIEQVDDLASAHHPKTALDAGPTIVLDFMWNARRYVVLQVVEPCDPTADVKNDAEAERASHLGLDEVHLSPREQEIVRLVAKGYPNKTIAGILDISPWTVSTHLRRVFAKLDVNSRAEMVATAIHTQLIPIDSA